MSREYYKGRLEKLKSELTRVKKITSFLFLVRLVLFLLFLATFVFSFSVEGAILYIVATIAALSAFISVALYNIRLEAKKREISTRIRFNEGEIESLNHKFDFRDNGAEFTELNEHLSCDFDIFSDGSLYQFLNRSVTSRGKSRFAASLVACDLRRESILSRSEAIDELQAKSSFIEDFATIGSDIKENGKEVDNLVKWINLDGTKHLFINTIRHVLPACSLIALLLCIIGELPITFLGATFTISLCAVFLKSAKLNKTHALLGHSAKILNKYSKLIHLIEKEQFNSSLLKREKERLNSASRHIESLENILERFDYRYNIFASVVLNGIFAYDFHTYMALMKWRRAHRDSVDQWLDAITEFDSLLGFGVYAANCKDSSVYADIVDGEFRITAEDMAHPLIAPQGRVANSIEILGRPAVTIITGANMAGKSTFLRTLAVNLILGMNGAPVCAKSFAFSPVKILSSIKIQDSLMNRESYFYAELLRLSEILTSSSEQRDSLIILDEILRGTNTRDKQEGSIGLLRKIIASGGVVVIATHDLVIGRMEEEYPEFVSNYCFEVEISGDKLSFDYKLKRGISSKLNASFLMRQMGIID